MKAFAVAIIFIFGSAALVAVAAPTFADYPVSAPLFVPKEVDLSSHPGARQFRTMLREAAKKGPNFAGKCVVAKWGCGTGCIDWAIVDLENGRVFFDNKLRHLLWIVGWDPKESQEFLDYKVDSGLLVAQGATDDLPDKVCRYYLQWTGTELKLVSKEVIFEGKVNSFRFEVRQK